MHLRTSTWKIVEMSRNLFTHLHYLLKISLVPSVSKYWKMVDYVAGVITFHSQEKGHLSTEPEEQ